MQVLSKRSFKKGVERIMIAFSRAISGLRVAEQNLYVTSNNISNVNTEGYHRQRLVQSELQKTSRGNFSIGLAK